MDHLTLNWTLDLGDVITAVLGGIGLFSLFFAGAQLRQGRRAQQTQILLSLRERLDGIEGFPDFLYRLDYAGLRAWRFDPTSFPLSDEERVLDAALYELSFIGSLVDAGDVAAADLGWLRSRARIVLGNREVQAYLAWLKGADQRPDHDAFAGAMSLYAALFGHDDNYRALKAYLR